METNKDFPETPMSEEMKAIVEVCTMVGKDHTKADNFKLVYKNLREQYNKSFSNEGSNKICLN